MRRMVCGEIHKQENGCRQEIPAHDRWKFCPTCGRSTGHVQLDKLDGALTAPLNTAVTREIQIRNEGLTAVSVSLDLEAQVPQLRLADSVVGRDLSIVPTIPLKMAIHLPAFDSSRPWLGTLIV